jgi:hypothetical protein
MIRPLRHLFKPVAESHLAVALAVSAVAMALVVWGIIWQMNIIVYQRGVIGSLYSAHFGG